ncbi:substrate-binding domain-containing protein [Tepidibacillus marianensis]|uniref:substrate-binding domain-containing protein n=1 Tax=Tepidibacillus marianensis TaxID=3131995 RepID=UPI0030D49768
MRKKSLVVALLLVVSMMLFVVGCGSQSSGTATKPVEQAKPTTLRLATTTSTQDSGLLDYFLPKFEKKYNIKVEVLAQGTGQAIETASRGDADVILVHAKKSEEKFVADGDGVKRFDVMYNDFVIVGPKKDPDGIKGKSLDETFKAITSGKAPFVSRGDDSGTNKKELDEWKKIGVEPKGNWYQAVGKGMGDTLTMTSEEQGYTLTDRATYSSMKDKLNLAILVEGDKGLLNPYGVIAVNPKKHPGVNNKDAQKFIDFILSPEGQQIIRDFKVQGTQLFFTYDK